MSVWVTNIQRMCFDDGPGIRTTVFMKGCSLHCPWCSNPENIGFGPEAYEKNGVGGIYGKEYLPAELEEILLKDQKFGEPDGGVTFSGGEAFMQAEGLADVLERLKRKRVHIAAETALFVPEDQVSLVLPHIDYVIADIKILERSACRSVLGGDIELYRKNVRTVYESGKLKLFRVPCCPEYTFTDDGRTRIWEFLQQYPDVPVQLFAIHDLGAGKYESLHRSMWKTKGMEERTLSEYCVNLRKEGISAEIIHI